MNGSVVAAVVMLFASFSRLASSLLTYDRNEEKEPLSFFFIIGFFTVSLSTFHLSTSREDYLRVSESLILAAEALEKQASSWHMRKMMNLTQLSRILIAAYIGEAVCAISITLVLWIPSEEIPMAFLCKDSVYCQLVWCVELITIPLGMTSVLSFVVFHLEVTLCMTCMYDILGELFRTVPTRETAYELIRIHQLLLNASKIFRDAFSTQWFGLLSNFLTIMIVSTFTMITKLLRVTQLSVLVVICFSFLFGACISGDMITVSSSSIGFSVYQGDWVHRASELRGDLSLVIFRSQKIVGITAGLLGDLNLVQLKSVLENWYKYIQALLRLT